MKSIYLITGGGYKIRRRQFLDKLIEYIKKDKCYVVDKGKIIKYIQKIKR